MTRTEARILAEELYKLMRKDVKRIVEETVIECSDEWVGVGEAANILGAVLVLYITIYLIFLIQRTADFFDLRNRN